MTHEKLPEKTPVGHWVQTERAAHEAWAKLIAEAPKAAQLMHILVARVGDNNAVVIGQKNLMRLMGVSRPTVQRAVKKLKDDLWVEVRQIGDTGTTNAYVINDRVAWLGKRDGIRYSLFSAAVVISDDEQPDAESLGKQTPLRRLPKIGENQLPTGPGQPPPSEPSLPGLEPDLPSAGNQSIELEPPQSIQKRSFRPHDGEQLIELGGRMVIAKTPTKYIGDDPDTGEPIFITTDVEYLELTPDVIRERMVSDDDTHDL